MWNCLEALAPFLVIALLIIRPFIFHPRHFRVRVRVRVWRLLAAANIGSFTGVMWSSCWLLELFLLYRFADKEGNEKGALGCGRKKERKKASKQASDYFQWTFRGKKNWLTEEETSRVGLGAAGRGGGGRKRRGCVCQLASDKKRYLRGLLKENCRLEWVLRFWVMKAGSDSEQQEGRRRRSEAAPGGAEEEQQEEAISRTNKIAEEPVEEEKQQTYDDAVEGVPDDCGSQALKRVQEAEPSTWLAAPPSLLQSAMQASEYLFTLIATTCTEKNLPLDKLLTQGFDTEQVWQQIDLQARPTLTSIKKRLRQIENTKVKKDFFFVSSSFTKEEAQRDSSAKRTRGFLKFLGIF